MEESDSNSVVLQNYSTLQAYIRGHLTTTTTLVRSQYTTHKTDEGSNFLFQHTAAKRIVINYPSIKRETSLVPGSEKSVPPFLKTRKFCSVNSFTVKNEKF